MGFVIGIAATSALIAYLGIFASIHPPSEKLKKWFHMAFLVFAIVNVGLFAAQSYYDKKDKDAQSAQDKKAIDDLVANAKQAQSRYEEVIRILASSPKPLEDAMAAVAIYAESQPPNQFFQTTNLDTLLSNDDASLVGQRNEHLIKLAPCAEQAFKTFMEQLKEIAKSNNDSVDSQVNDFSDFIKTLPVSGDYQVQVHFIKHPNWVFSLSLSAHNNAAIFVFSSSGPQECNLQIHEPSSTGVGVTFYDANNLTLDENVLFSKYQDILNQKLGIMFARQEKSFPLQ